MRPRAGQAIKFHVRQMVTGGLDGGGASRRRWGGLLTEVLHARMDPKAVKDRFKFVLLEVRRQDAMLDRLL